MSPVTLLMVRTEPVSPAEQFALPPLGTYCCGAPGMGHPF